MTRATVARAGLTVSAWFFVSRVLGSLRLVVTTNQFHPADLGLFYAAFRLPDLVFQLVAAGALGSALIPILGRLFIAGEDRRAWAVVSTVTTLLFAGLALLATVAFLLAPELVRLGTPGYSDVEVARTVDLTRVMLLSPVFLALGGVATSILNARNLFVASALAPVAYNVGIIVGSLALAPFLGITGLAVAVVIGSAAHLLLQLRPILRAGFRYQRALALHDPDTRQALVLMAPRALGQGVTQITFIVVTALATGLGAPAVAAFSIAFGLLQIPLGLVSIPLGIVLLPALSGLVATEADEAFARALALTLRLLLFLMVAMAGLLAVLAHQAVAILLPTYDPANAAMVAGTFVVFLAGLPAHAMIAILTRAFYARQNTRMPVLWAVAAVVINTTLAAIFVGPFGLGGIALAIACAAWAEAGGLLLVLRRAVPDLALGALASVLARVATAAVLASGAAIVTVGAVGHLLGHGTGFVPALVEAVAASIAYGLVLLSVSWLLRSTEPKEILAFLGAAVRGNPSRSDSRAGTER